MKNTADQPVAFRDDAGKHIVAAGEEFEVVGEQHKPAVRAAIARAKNEDVVTATEEAVTEEQAEEPKAHRSR